MGFVSVVAESAGGVTRRAIAKRARAKRTVTEGARIVKGAGAEGSVTKGARAMVATVRGVIEGLIEEVSK